MGSSAARDRARQELGEKMRQYYRNASTYHDDIGAVAEERPSAEERPLLEAIRRMSPSLPGAPADRAALELGCGACGSAEALLSAASASTYVGVDASPFAIEEARRLHPSYRLSVGDATALDLPDASFDVVLSVYVLEHMVYPERMLDEAIRVTKPGGLIALIAPVCDLPWAMPSSLRHRRGAAPFVVAYAARRWAEALRLRFDPSYFAFSSVDDPIVLRPPPGYAFSPDDDQIYAGSSLELTKYLKTKGCSIEWRAARDISSYIANGRRPLVDLARRAAFFGYRLSIATMDASAFTTTISLVARKR